MGPSQSLKRRETKRKAAMGPVGLDSARTPLDSGSDSGSGSGSGSDSDSEEEGVDSGAMRTANSMRTTFL